MSTSTDIEVKAREAEEFKLIYKTELDEAIKRKREYINNIYKAYAKI